ncbi:MAG TPA: hypothetical protein VF742_05680, partial [Terracidiphilus sp.]
GEITYRLDNRKTPAPSGARWLHALRFREPLRDVEFLSVSGACAVKSGVLGKKSNHVTLAGARPAAEELKIAVGKRPEPAPRPAQRACSPRVDAIHSRLPCEKAPGKGADHSGRRHGLTRGEDSNQSDVFICRVKP